MNGQETNVAIPLDTLVPLKIAHLRVDIPRRTLYRWAKTGRLKTITVDNELCARFGDMIELDETRRDAMQAKIGAAL